jgi:predicted transcriptional regulator
MGWITDLLKEIPLSAVLKDELGKLEAEHERTKRDLKEANDENLRLKETLKKFESRDQLEDTEIKILVSLVHKGGRLTTELVAIHLQIDVTRAQYFLTSLTEAEFISAAHSSVAATSYQLVHRGYEYLVRNNLV